MPPEIIDWITACIALIAVTAASYFAYRQIAIQKRQVEIQDAQAGYQKQQTNISKLQADIARKQTDIIMMQADIARQQLAILENQEHDRQKEKLSAELDARVIHDKINDRFSHSYLEIENKGQSEARDVIISTDVPSKINFLHEVPEKILSLPSGAKLKFLMLPTGNMSPYFNLDMRWADDTGESHHKRLPLRIH